MANTNNKYDYQVLIAGTSTELSSMVVAMMNDGWKCQGGVHTYQDLYPKFCQAMVKESGGSSGGNTGSTPRKSSKATATTSPEAE